MDTLLVPLELLCWVARTEFTDKKLFIRWEKRQVRDPTLKFSPVYLDLFFPLLFGTVHNTLQKINKQNKE
jgi:hypothetical protein